MQITAKMVKDLREMTGIGPLDCKMALEINNGDTQRAIEYLREKGLRFAMKKAGSDRSMNEGIIQICSHPDGKWAVIVEVNCETDFVAKTDVFKTFAHDIAAHIVNRSPMYIHRSDVPDGIIKTNSGFEEDSSIETIDRERLNTFFESVVLLEQPFFKDNTKVVERVLFDTIAELGERIRISRFNHFKLGQ